MQANQLRIGNYIKDLETGRIGTVRTISSKKATIKLEYSTICQALYEFDHIPLTDEILLKCGFVNDGGDWKIRIYGEDNRFYIGWFVLFISYDYKTDSRKYVVPMGDYRNETEADVKYFHQLQNLYFSLTGKELEVNL